MSRSTGYLTAALTVLSGRARARGLTDSAWAARAGIPKETLSRLWRRRSCDFRTLCALADAVGAQLGVLEGRDCAAATADGHFPLRVDRGYEEQLLELCTAGDFDPTTWALAGPRFFVAGLAVLLAGSGRLERLRLLALAERLYPGASEVAVFERWLRHTPLRPDRFLPLLDARLRRAA